MRSLFFALLLTLNSCSPQGESSSKAQLTQSVQAEEGVVFGASVRYENFSAVDQDKVERALDLIQQVVKSDEFRERVLEHTYQGEKRFVDNNGFTNAEIYQVILAGSEELTPGADGEMDLVLELYSDAGSKTVGYTYTNTLKIWLNRKFFDA